MHHVVALITWLVYLVPVVGTLGGSYVMYLVAGAIIWLPRYVARQIVERTFSVLRVLIWIVLIFMGILPVLHLALAPAVATPSSRACIDTTIIPLFHVAGDALGVSPFALVFATAKCHSLAFYESLFTMALLPTLPQLAWIDHSASTALALAYQTVGQLEPDHACQVALDRLALSPHAELRAAMHHCVTWLWL